MRFIAIALAVLCVVAYAAANDKELRVRREANPQGSIVLQGQKPLSGPDRRPSLDLDYHQRVFDKNGATADAYGGLNIRPGMAPQPHIGIQAERQFGNGFVGGFGQVQRGPHGRPDPTFGLNAGFRFRRDVEAVEEQRVRREANPQGSIVLEGQKPLSGPDRRPSLDLDYHQRVFDKNGATADAYGGLNIRPGMAPQPHIGIQAERNYGNGFIRGFGQVQRGPGGRPDPTFGIGGGFRFRRDVEAVEEQRVRREANPQGSIVLQGQKPLSGPDRRPSLDLDYHQRVFDKNDATADAYGGLNIRPGMAPQPHIGIQAERKFGNGFVGGFGQVQRGPHGRPDPTFGLNAGFRFRRDVEDVENEQY